ncbi:hypothetical protein O9993_05170 [Vibrio lentus]|nr:hypothetical protein [Vibrio lentus]
MSISVRIVVDAFATAFVLRNYGVVIWLFPFVMVLTGLIKTAYVTWFEILPFLREGRIVVTNIEGLKPKESIEELLGEKFPDSARLIVILHDLLRV